MSRDDDLMSRLGKRGRARKWELLVPLLYPGGRQQVVFSGGSGDRKEATAS